MFDHPLFLPIALSVIVLGLFYLIMTHRNGSPNEQNEDEKGVTLRQVQCPSCQRWKKMGPIRREELLDEVEALKRSVLPGPQHRFLHEYRCRFCGHVWQEHYPV